MLVRESYVLFWYTGDGKKRCTIWRVIVQQLSRDKNKFLTYKKKSHQKCFHKVIFSKQYFHL